MAYDQKLASVRGLIEKAQAQLAAHPQPHAALVLADGCRIAAALAGLVAITTTKNPTETEAAQALQVREAARQIRAMVPASRQRIARAKNSGMAEIRDRMTGRAGRQGDAGRAAELRASILALAPADRLARMQRAVAEGDRELLLAVLSASAGSSGINARVQGDLRQHYKALAAPEVATDLEVLMAVDHCAAAILTIASEAAADLLQVYAKSKSIADRHAAAVIATSSAA